MIIDDNLLEPLAAKFRIKNKSIVLAGGCFDVLHKAHEKFLVNAKKSGDILIILLESDENIKKLKGHDRPQNNLEQRALTLESLGFIDLVVKLSPKVSDKYYYKLTKLIQPDIIALTKNDPLTDKKNIQAESVGGRTKIIMDRDENFSSTKLINKK